MHHRKTASSRPANSHHLPFLDPLIYKGKGRKSRERPKRPHQSRKQPGRGNPGTNRVKEPPSNLPEDFNVDMPEPELVQADSIREEDSAPLITHTDIEPSISSKQLIPPLPALYSKNGVVTHPKIAYTQEVNRSLILHSVLLEIWDVEWNHPVSVHWGCEWLWHRCEVQISVTDCRHDQTGSLLWLTGDFILTGVGAPHDDPALRHETIMIPFTTTILRPSSLPKAKIVQNPSLPPYPNSIWIEASDWNVSWVESPLRMDTHEEHGVFCITGRVWWFQKQLVPLDSSS